MQFSFQLEIYTKHFTSHHIFYNLPKRLAPPNKMRLKMQYPSRSFFIPVPRCYISKSLITDILASASERKSCSGAVKKLLNCDNVVKGQNCITIVPNDPSWGFLANGFKDTSCIGMIITLTVTGHIRLTEMTYRRDLIRKKKCLKFNKSYHHYINSSDLQYKMFRF